MTLSDQKLSPNYNINHNDLAEKISNDPMFRIKLDSNLFGQLLVDQYGLGLDCYKANQTSDKCEFNYKHNGFWSNCYHPKKTKK